MTGHMSDSHDNELREPFPWMSKNRPTGPYRFTLRHPASEAVFGSFLVFMGVFVLLASMPDGIVAGVIVVTTFGGMGVFLLVMAVARGRWLRNYRKIHGYSPFPMV